MADNTNLYFNEYMEANGENIGPSARAHRFKPVTKGIMRKFTALILYMGVIKKNNMNNYWSINPIINTPFVRTVFSRDE